MTKRELLDAGFRFHANDPNGFEKYATELYQYRMRDSGDKTLYFINVFYYPPMPQHKIKEGWKCEARMYADDTSMTVQYHDDNVNPNSIIGFFARLHLAMHCGSDPHND